jgi:hypothetical protein
MNVLVLALLVVITACTGGTSLEGSIDCGTNTCGSGQVCVTWYPGIDAAPPEENLPVSSCAAPDDCAVTDCSGYDCPPCVTSLCSGCTGCARLEGRQLSCSA